MRNKYFAWFLAILFGSIGVHKFYLWKYIQWVLYFCFCFTYVPTIISIFEWVVYIFNTDEWFDINYNIKAIRDQKFIQEFKNNNFK